ncbi:hypothetical protein BvCmsNSNP023_00531 [Escherichia coli]|nr:hypothetical protein BvCmsNSNP023_00531 [Escherichia coli]GDO44804.1 hypothetical protein BvCmsNSNP036_03293 [Escherichia coli]GDP07401.1 hypothetical protein BvCmsNSNP022_02919 [Escherichia coli]GDV17207.1 hypothetical protein BvCmsSIP044_01991 [Escherichia coli]
MTGELYFKMFLVRSAVKIFGQYRIERNAIRHSQFLIN